MSKDTKISIGGLNRSGKYDIASFKYYYYNTEKKNIYFCKDYWPFKKCITIDKYLDLIEKDFIAEMEDDLKKPRTTPYSSKWSVKNSIYYDWLFVMLIEKIIEKYDIEISDSQTNRLVKGFKDFFKKRIRKYGHDFYYKAEVFNYDIKNIFSRTVAQSEYESVSISNFSQWFIENHEKDLLREFLKILKNEL